MTSEERDLPQDNHADTEPEVVETLERSLLKARQLADDYLNNWKRTQADYANLKRRTDQEKLEMAKNANTQLILNLLPVLDDFERAFQNMPARMAKTEWAEGFRLIASKMLTILDAQGLKPIEAVGQPFDPGRHDACLHEKGAESIVTKDLRRGYTLFDKVIRPTQAVVGNGDTDETGTKQDINHINDTQKDS
jgi:molecular chaperone GrpE